jgi:hypothetical protein
MAQKTYLAGDVLTASDLNTYSSHEGGAWTTYTPTWTQSIGVTKTVNRAVYARAGRLIHFSVKMTATGAGTGSNAMRVTLPVNATTSTIVAGQGYFLDSSSGIIYSAILYVDAVDSVQLFATSTDASNVALGSAVFTAAIAAGDVVSISGSYEAAS